MPDTNPFGSRDDDPLLQNDPLAPSSEDDDEREPGEQENEQHSSSSEASSDETLTDDPDGLFSSTEDASQHAQSTNSSQKEMPSRADLLSYLLENRAALDVLFEMMAFDRADGDEEEYRHFLQAMQERHELATQQYRDALEVELPSTELDEEIPPSVEDNPPVSS